MDKSTKETIIIIIILFILYLHECKKEGFTLPSNNIPYIKINNKSQIAIVTVFPDELKPIDHLIIQNYKIYCIKSNLALYVFTNKQYNKSIQWDSVNSVVEVLKNKNHIYAIWMNPNIIFNRSNVYITKYISQHKDADIIFSKDPIYDKYVFSMNIIIYKNTDWTNNILNKLIHNKQNHKGNIIIEHFGEKIGEHIILNNMIEKDAIDSNKKDPIHLHKQIKILPANDINALPLKKTLKENLILNTSNILEKTKYKLIYYINEQLY